MPLKTNGSIDDGSPPSSISISGPPPLALLPAALRLNHVQP